MIALFSLLIVFTLQPDLRMDPNDATTEAINTMKVLASQMTNALHVLEAAAATGDAPTHHVVNISRDQQPQGFHGKPSDDPEEWLERSKPVPQSIIEQKTVSSHVRSPCLKKLLGGGTRRSSTINLLLGQNFATPCWIVSSTTCWTTATQKLYLKEQARRETVHEFADVMKQLFREVDILESMQVLPLPRSWGQSSAKR